MDTTFQIQEIKSEMNNMKLQIENIEMQNNNGLIMLNTIGEQLLNLSFQMLNTGLQTFNIGSFLSTNANNFYDQLKEISERINTIMISKQKMNQNITTQQQMEEQQIEKEKYNLQNKCEIKAVFDYGHFGCTMMIVEPDISISELFQELNDFIGEKDYNQINYFIMNSYSVFKDDKGTLKKYYPNIYIKDSINIFVMY